MVISTIYFLDQQVSLKKCDILIYKVLLIIIIITWRFLDGTFCAVYSFPVDGNH